MTRDFPADLTTLKVDGVSFGRSHCRFIVIAIFVSLSLHTRRRRCCVAAVEPLFRRAGTWRRLAWSNLGVHELSARACPPRRFSRGSTRVDGAALFIEARRLCAASRLLVATGLLIAAGGCHDSGRSSDRSPPGPTTSGTFDGPFSNDGCLLCEA